MTQLSASIPLMNRNSKLTSLRVVSVLTGFDPFHAYIAQSLKYQILHSLINLQDKR